MDPRLTTHPLTTRPAVSPAKTVRPGLPPTEPHPVQFARSALARTDELAKQALSSQPDRTNADVQTLFATVSGELITTPNTHGAVVGAVEAARAGLPVTALSSSDDWWLEIWNLWTRYFALAPPFLLRVYESTVASQVSVQQPN